MSKKNLEYPTEILGIFLKGIKRGLSRSLFYLWLIISSFLFFGIYFEYFNVDSFSVSDYLSVCMAGLSFTFALFNISKSTFEIDELKNLMVYEGRLNSGRKVKKGELFFEYLSPFILTTTILAFLSIVSLLAPFLRIDINDGWLPYFKTFYLSFMILGIFSLLNITYMAIEDLSNSILRKSKDD